MEERLKIAVFVDFDNIEIGVKTTLGVAFDIGTILEAIKERGEVVTKIAYGDWTRAGDYSRLLTQHAIKMVQRNLTPGGDKNGADINLALDALEMALTHDHINAYVIVGGDSDFLSLVEKLKQYDKTVLVVGGRAFTSVILQRNCHEFIAYENLVNTGQGRRQQERGRPAKEATSSSIRPAFPLVRRALKVLSEREVTPQLGLLKSTLLQLDSTFSEKNYGAGSFRDFAEKLAQAGLLRLNQSGRNLLVEIKETDAEEPEAQPVQAHTPAPPHVHPAAAPHAHAAAPSQAHAAAAEEPPKSAEPAAAPASVPAGEALAAQQAEAIGMMRRILETSTTPLRWPMYVRNVKQLMRAGEPGFDERRYGFGGILDLLRGGQREGLLRLERDRQGVLRVFPGTAIQRPGAPAGPAGDSAAVAAAGDEQPATAERERIEAVEAPDRAPEPAEAVIVEPGEAQAEVPSEAGAEAAGGGPAEAEPVEGEPVEIETGEVEAQPKRARPRRASAARKSAAPKKPRAAANRTRPRRATKPKEKERDTE